VYGFYGKDFEEVVEDTAARPPPERLPTDQKIYSVPENYVSVRTQEAEHASKSIEVYCVD
jgi:hypothetical protein